MPKSYRWQGASIPGCLPGIISLLWVRDSEFSPAGIEFSFVRTGMVNHLPSSCVPTAKLTLVATQAVFGWLVAGWLAGQTPHEINVHVLPEQYFPLTIIS